MKQGESINRGDKVQLVWPFPELHRIPMWGEFVGTHEGRYLLKLREGQHEADTSVSQEFLLYKLNDYSEVE